MYKQQAITNIVNPVKLSNTSGLQNLSKKLKAEANKDIQNQKEIYLIKAQTSLVDSSNKLLETYNSNPAKLDEELNKNIDKMLSNVDNKDIKLNLYKQFLTIKQPLLKKAEQNRIKQEDNDRRNSIYNNINSKLGTLEAFYDNMFNEVNSQDDVADYYMNLQEINNLLQSKSSRNNPLFNQKDFENITKENNKIKINSAYKHFNTLFETDPDAFKKNYSQWLDNPQTIQDKYGLSQDEYKSILSNAKKLDELLDSAGNTNLDDRINILKQNSYENELEYQFNVAKQYKNNILKENTDFNGIKFLNNLNNMLESAHNDGLDNRSYNKYKNELRSYYNNIANQILLGEADGLEDGGWFGKSNVLYEVVNLMDEYIGGYNSIERADILGQTIALLGEEQDLNLNSNGIYQKELAKKITTNVIADYYQIPRDNPNKFELIKQKKQERETTEKNKILNEIVDDLMKQNNIFNLEE